MPYRNLNPAKGEVITKFATHADAEFQLALSVANSVRLSDGPVQPRLEGEIEILSNPDILEGDKRWTSSDKEQI